MDTAKVRRRTGSVVSSARSQGSHETVGRGLVILLEKVPEANVPRSGIKLRALVIFLLKTPQARSDARSLFFNGPACSFMCIRC